MSINASDTENIQSVFCERSSLVEYKHVGLTGDIDSVGRYAEDAGFAETLNRKSGSHSETCGKGGRYDYHNTNQLIQRDVQDRFNIPMVIRSKARKAIVLQAMPIRMNCTAETRNPAPAIMASTAMNRIESL